MVEQIDGTYADVVKLHVGREVEVGAIWILFLVWSPKMSGSREFVYAIARVVVGESKGGLVEQQRGGKGLQIECSRKGVSQVGVSSWGAWS